MLVAIAIPIFTSQLEKSRESVDLSNVRAAYAEVMTTVLTGDTSPDDSSIKYTASSKTWSKEVKPLKQSKDGWTTDMATVEIGGVKYDANWDSVKANGKCTISITSEGVATLTWGAAS